MFKNLAGENIMVRECFLTGELVFFAQERAKRPYNFRKLHIAATPSEFCPFCLENESMTPKEIFSTKNKRIRIVPNKYPFISKNDPTHYGIHDVLIDTARHDEKFYMFSYEHITDVLKSIRHRVAELEEDEKILYVQVFKNDGIDAGASQSHSHWQIAALSVVPPKYRYISDKLEEYYNKNGKCYFCSLDFEDRIIEQNDEFIAYVPYDAKFPYEMFIIPKKHIHNFKLFDDNQTEKLSIILKHCVMRLASLYEGISYNICFFNSPKSECKNELHSHFYIQIIPRIGHMAGFEFSTGCYINSVFPEKSAQVLRSVEINRG